MRRETKHETDRAALTMKADDLRALIGKVGYVVSSDATRPRLRQIKLQTIGCDRVRAIGSDGYRLAIDTAPIIKVGGSAEAGFEADLRRALFPLVFDAPPGTVLTLATGSREAFGVQARSASTGRELWSFSSPDVVSEDDFPPYEHNIPSEWECAYTFSSQALTDMLTGAKRSFPDLKIRLHFDEESVCVDHKNSVDVFEMDYTSPEHALEAPILCNLEYIREPLQLHFASEEHVTVKINGPLDPIGFYRGGELVNLTMPCRW